MDGTCNHPIIDGAAPQWKCVVLIMRGPRPKLRLFTLMTLTTAAAAAGDNDDDAAAGYYYYNPFCYYPFEKSNVECPFWTRL